MRRLTDDVVAHAAGGTLWTRLALPVKPCPQLCGPMVLSLACAR